MSTSVCNEFYLYLVNRVAEDGTVEASCKLPSTIDISRDDYEISLVEIQLPAIWHNVYDAEISVRLIDDAETEIRLEIPDGYYKTIDILATVIDRLTKRAEYKIENKPLNVYFALKKNQATGNMYIVLSPGVAAKFSERLMNVLGFQTNEIVNEEEDREVRFEFFSNVDLGMYSLIAECNVIPISTVGEYSGRVLRVFSPRRNEVSSISVREIYRPVVLNMMDRVTVTIRNMMGHQLIFSSDEMVILVHLRKVIKA